jgi:hypothetical protein
MALSTSKKILYVPLKSFILWAIQNKIFHNMKAYTKLRIEKFVPILKEL